VEGLGARGFFSSFLAFGLCLPLSVEISPVREITIKVLADEEFRLDSG